MKILIILISIMMITGIATAKRSGQGAGDGSGHRKRYKSEQCGENGESLQKHERKRHKKDMTPEELKQREERMQKRLRRMANGDEAEYNRLLKLRKDDPEAFRTEMRERRAQRGKNKNKNKGSAK